MSRIAFFGGTFDPVHSGHVLIALTLLNEFKLDRFYFLPAYHAPHKPDRSPTPALHRYAMLCLATAEHNRILVSHLELEKGEKRYTIDTLSDIAQTFPDDERFFVMGADSWSEIRTWRDWEAVLLAVNHIVVERPGSKFSTKHVTDRVRKRIVTIGLENAGYAKPPEGEQYGIFFTDSVHFDVSATEVREDLSDGTLDRVDDVPPEVAKYIEKYDLYI